MKSLVLASLALVALAATSARGATPDEDAEAIKQRAIAYVAAYNAHDAAALAQLWADDAVYLNRDTGAPIEGRAAIQQMFKEMFDDGEADQLSVTIQTIRRITPDVAIEDGTATITPTEGDATVTTYTAIHVNKDGQWYLNSVRETDTPVPPKKDHGQLEQLAWMVGDWADDGDDATVRTNWRWTKSGYFLIGNFAVEVDGQVDMEGTQVIGWDAAAGEIRSWVFDSEGGIGDGVWNRVGNEWIVTTTSTLDDGSQGKAINVYKPIDNDTFTWKSVNRELDGEEQPDVDEVPVRRQVAAAAPADANSAQVSTEGN